MEAIAMTVAMPMTTPSTVSAERSLLARSWSMAMRQPSRTEWSSSTPAERFESDRAATRDGRVDAEAEPNEEETDE